MILEYVRLVLSSAIHYYVIRPIPMSLTYAVLINHGMIMIGTRTYPNMIMTIQNYPNKEFVDLSKTDHN